MAAGLIEKVARLSTPQMIGSGRIARRAAAVRSLAAVYVESDADAYRAYVEAMRSARGRNAAERERILRAPRGGIISMPLKIARSALEVAEMGSEVARHAKPNLRSDAVAAVHLAAGAAQAAAGTVAANLATAPDDQRLEEARDLAARASELSRRLRVPGRAGGRGRGRARSGGSARR